MRSSIAVIGAGISGLGAAWALSQKHEVVVYEARDRLGGHSNTVDVPTPDGDVPVDTGFIVYNEVTYPHLSQLFAALDVPTAPSEMSFSVSVPGGVEYGASARGVLAHPSQLLRSSYRSMLSDIWRFRRLGPSLVWEVTDETIAELLSAHGFSDAFFDDYLGPMMGAIWSTGHEEIRQYPAVAMLRFLSNHGLITVTDRPAWRTVRGGSREYVTRLAAAVDGELRTGTDIRALRRHRAHVEIEADAGTESYDHVVLATHTDQALALLEGEATDAEAAALRALRYEANVAVLHTDASLMPRSRGAWTSWNTTSNAAGGRASVTYWMNRLQPLDTDTQIFVTLNPATDPDPATVIDTFDYSHPQFDSAAIAAQQHLTALQGTRRTWFAGAYLGYGFHEDGLQAGLNVAAALGSPAPWHYNTTPMSSAPAIPAKASV